MQSDAAMVEEYLESLPSQRRAALRDVILDNLGVGFEEVMDWGMVELVKRHRS